MVLLLTPEVVNGLYRNLVGQLSYWTRRPILAEMVASAAGQATNDAAAVLTQGSPLVTNAPNLATTVGIVGDYIRVGSQSNDLDEVYLIVATDGVSTLTFRLLLSKKLLVLSLSTKCLILTLL